MARLALKTLSRSGLPSRPKVLLVNPPCPFLAFPNAAPHLGVGYLASFLREHGFEVGYANLETRDPRDVELPEGYDLYAFTSVTPQYPFARALRDQVAHRALGLTAIGGAHASVSPEECLKDGFDYVVTGYGETALLGIVSRNIGPGRVTGEAVHPDSTPVPAWDLLYESDYDVSFGTRTGHVFASRGCPYECAYCCSPTIYGTRMSFRSAESVVEEIRSLRDRYGVETIYFFDPTFTLHRTRTRNLLERLAPLGLEWTCQTRVDHIDPELLSEMKGAGCAQVSYGVETGLEEVHANLNKAADVSLNATAIRMTHDAGMKVKTFLIGALPDDDERTPDRFKAFITANRPDRWLYSTFTPFPGTEYWTNPERYGIEIVRRDYRAYYPLGLNGRGPVNVASKHLDRDELEELRDDVLEFLRKEVPDPRVEEAIRRFPEQRAVFDACIEDMTDRGYMFGRERPLQGEATEKRLC